MYRCILSVSLLDSIFKLIPSLQNLKSETVQVKNVKKEAQQLVIVLRHCTIKDRQGARVCTKKIFEITLKDIDTNTIY